MFKRLLRSICLFYLVMHSMQVKSQESLPDNWFNLDLSRDSIIGVSTEVAYELLEGRDSETVIVAVLDSGCDIDHEDLAGKIWINDDEIPDNGIDDDENGYIDDINGWNFLGGPNGEHIEYDSYEITREYSRLREIYGGKFTSADNPEEFQYWTRVNQAYQNRSSKAMREYTFYRDIRDNTQDQVNLLKNHLQVDSLSIQAIDTLTAGGLPIIDAKTALIQLSRLVGGETDFDKLLSELDEVVHHYEVQVRYGYNTQYNPREIIGDDFEDPYEVGYGNNDVIGTFGRHGTHVAGIIAATRNNGIGINGVADNVLIMPLKMVPNGDERDKDVANAIRYAVDNGAKVINMSFGKSFEYRKEIVDEAIDYAIAKGAILVTGAGNDGKNIDERISYPTPIRSDSVHIPNWFSVGAISSSFDEDLLADFSNYGASTVDVFAPGVSINSTVPDSQYEYLDGTSMASPVVAGVTALLVGYFPGLSSDQIYEILMESVTTFPEMRVDSPGTEDQVTLDEISRTGGIINAAKAVERALELE